MYPTPLPCISFTNAPITYIFDAIISFIMLFLHDPAHISGCDDPYESSAKLRGRVEALRPKGRFTNVFGARYLRHLKSTFFRNGH